MTKKQFAGICVVAGFGVYLEIKMRILRKDVIEALEKAVETLDHIQQSYTDEEFERIVENFDND